MADCCGVGGSCCGGGWDCCAPSPSIRIGGSGLDDLESESERPLEGMPEPRFDPMSVPDEVFDDTL